jgi:hypothetical protein
VKHAQISVAITINAIQTCPAIQLSMSKTFAKEVLAMLRKHGSDVSKPHQFEFYLQIPAKPDATQAAREIRRNGFTAKVSRLGKLWVIVAGKKLIPATTDLVEHAHFFQKMALAVGGEFDGWEAELPDA